MKKKNHTIYEEKQSRNDACTDNVSKCFRSRRTSSNEHMQQNTGAIHIRIFPLP